MKCPSWIELHLFAAHEVGVKREAEIILHLIECIPCKNKYLDIERKRKDLNRVLNHV